jgi:rsbT co-antagonist protein RsbR
MNEHEEILRLRAKVDALEQLLTEQERISIEQAGNLEEALRRLEARTRLLDEILNGIPDAMVVCDGDGNITHRNAAAADLLSVRAPEPSSDQPPLVYGAVSDDDRARFPMEMLPLAQVLRGEAVTGEDLFVSGGKRPEGLWVQANARALHAEDGAIVGAVALFRDISERKRSERSMEDQIQLEREKSDALTRLKSALQELSSPILEVWDDVLALPMIGVIDSERSAALMERLLRVVEEKQCRFVIIDITGVEIVDTATADRLLQLVRAVGILGARCVLTGAKAAVAQTLVSIGADLGPLLTLRSLKQGLWECLRLMEERPRMRISVTRGRAPRS